MSEKLFTIYKISGNGHTYVGMTTQTLSKRFAQHKQDARQVVDPGDSFTGGPTYIFRAS